MRNHKSFFLAMPVISLLFITLAIGQTTRTAKLEVPAEGVFSDQYYSLYLAQTKCGWAHMQFERRGKEIHSQNQFHMEAGRDAMVIVVDVEAKSVETLEGKPLAFENKVTMAGSTTIYRGKVKKNVVSMEIVKPDASVQYNYTISPDVVMDWGSYQQIMNNINKSKTNITVRSLDPTLGQGNILETKTQIVGPETIKVAGKEISGIKTISIAEKLGPMPIISFVDPMGKMLYTEMQMGFAKVQLVAEDKMQATTAIAPKELFMDTMVKLKQPMPALSAGLMNFKVIYTGEGTMPKFPKTSIQRVVKSKDKTQFLRIDPASLKKASKGRKAPAATMASSSFVNLKDPVLIQLADKAAGAAQSPEEIARNLCHFVHRHITEKNLATPFASAGEAARSQSGDCSEHAVLMTALARIKQIPARAVMGLVYTSAIGEYGAFGYHMWTQVWLDGRWVDMDPTFDEVQVNPSHIAIDFCDLADDSLHQQVAQLIQFIGQLEIVPVE
jgi:hypothetical protein